VDPVTLVVTAVALGASAGMTETASNMIKDAYAALKAQLGRNHVDLSGVERNPTSQVQRAALEETLSDIPAALDEELLAAAEQVANAVAATQPEVAEVVGVELRDVQAEFIRVRSISSAGTGFRGEGLTVQGGVDIGDVTAGRLAGGPGPTER
jgi:hypothetical protein